MLRAFAGGHRRRGVTDHDGVRLSMTAASMVQCSHPVPATKKRQ